MQPLPVDPHLDDIQDALRAHRRLILMAPPGSGKSTRVPRALTQTFGRTVVLQPRRVAARSLAHWVAESTGQKLGEQIGYQVRFEQKQGPKTQLLFQTYGVFWQQLLNNPTCSDTACVVLDEFHERALEADACLAWLTQLQATHRPDLAVVVMSATLEAEALRNYWPTAPSIAVNTRPYPVAYEYLPARPGETLPAHVLRAFQHMRATGEKGSVLVFVPGLGELLRTQDALRGACEAAGYRLLALHGGQSPTEQQAAVMAPASAPCVVVATNVAETSLTLAGVSAVIDSGLVRTATYDAERELDTLKLGYTSLASMTQRAGRAGRTGPGRCIRLWAASLESSLEVATPPAITRCDLTRVALDVAVLPEPPEWLTPPPPERWVGAQERLRRLGALESSGTLTNLGRRLLPYGLHPALARVLEAAREAGCLTFATAMVAIFEAADRRRIADEGDLYWLAFDLVHAGPQQARKRGWEREVVETWQQLQRQLRPAPADQAMAMAPEAEAPERREKLTRCWLSAFGDRLATWEAPSYKLKDGRAGVVLAGKPPTDQWLLALELHETSGRGKKQVTIPVYLPVEPAWAAGDAPEMVSTVVEWDAERQRVWQWREWSQGGLVRRREALPHAEWDWSAAETLLVSKLLSGEASVPAHDDDVEQWLRRARKAHEVWPELGVPALDEEAWEVIYHELLRQKTGLGEVTREDMLDLLREYVGWDVSERLERSAPRAWKLPAGRSGRITFGEEGPPELSARLGDFIGMQGTLNLLEGRVPVLFDILAPNYRTVQKTFDLTGFWQRTYPEVKKELKRRYPKHPWP
jgi:ATP-dependent helicase HrpB